MYQRKNAEVDLLFRQIEQNNQAAKGIAPKEDLIMNHGETNLIPFLDTQTLVQGKSHEVVSMPSLTNCRLFVIQNQ